MNKSGSPQVHYLESPFVYSGVLYQTRVHVENMLISMDKDQVLALWHDVIGKPIMFSTIIDELLTPMEKSVKQTLTLLWNDAKIQQLEHEVQIVVSEVLGISENEHK